MASQEDSMGGKFGGGKFGVGVLAAALMVLAAANQPVIAQNNPEGTPPPAGQAPNAPAPAPPANAATNPPSVTVLDTSEVQGILGSEVRSTADENMGRIVDVMVDGQGRIRAAIIDFGGFLGVGSRKIAVDWKALHFVPAAAKRYSVVLELTRDQVKPAPEYKEGKPLIILGASGNLEPFP
jgi:PRC-barrel domain